MTNALAPWRPTVGDPFDYAAACHLLRRCGLGYGTPESVEAAVERGLEATLDSLFADRASEPAILGGVNAVLGQGDIERLRAWWMALILAGKAPLVERVTLMWHGHFATSNAKVDDVGAMYAQNDLFRKKGLGDFRELLHAVSKDTAMLRWLDGDLNRRGSPNENFARELFELFGLGIGNYTERDIQEAARSFTGQGTDGDQFVVREKEHDSRPKTVFGKSGNFRGKDVIDLVLAHEACPQFIAARLLREFGPDTESLDDDQRNAITLELARVIVAEEWRIDRTLRRFFESAFFFAHRADRISSPVELIVQASRRLGLRVPPAEAARIAASLGQALFEPPSVKGWDGGRTWIDAGTWIRRCNALETASRRAKQTMSEEALLKHIFPEPSLRTSVANVLAASTESLEHPALLATLLAAPEAQLT